MKTISVRTPCGFIRGMELDGCFSFRGIPYAKPPINELRFAPPEEHNPFSEEYDATHYRNIAMQTPNPRILRAIDDLGRGEQTVQSEDCLYLNITTCSVDNGKRPVLIYIHGGANLGGYSYSAMQDPEYLVKKGKIVFVSVDFRTGIFGFLYHPFLNTDILNTSDCLASIHWIYKNITAFGGNPDNITLIGQSSGAHNIVDIIASNKARGLIKNAVIQSASFGRGCFSPRQAIQKAEMLFKMLEIYPEKGNLREQLARYSSKELTQISTEYATVFLNSDEWGYQWGAVHDGCEEPAASAMIQGFRAARNGIRIIVGHTENEAGSFRPYMQEFTVPA